MIFDMGKNLHKPEKAWEAIGMKVDAMQRCLMCEMNARLFPPPHGRHRVADDLERQIHDLTFMRERRALELLEFLEGIGDD